MMIWKRLLTAVLMTLVHMGCATFPADRLPEVKSSDLRLKTENKTKVFSRWVGDFGGKTVNEDQDVILAAMHKKRFEQLLKETDCCILTDSTNEADVILSVTTYGEEKLGALFFAVLTGATFYVIPSWITDETRIEARVEGRGMVKEYQLDDSYVLAQWLPLILVVPFQGGAPLDVAQKVEKNVFKTLVLKMKEDGFLESNNMQAASAN
jgi:hypothetical protein